MASEKYLAIDIGASSGRAIVGTLEDGKITLEEMHRFENGPTERGGSLYWNIESIFAELKEGVRKSLAKYPDIKSMGIDTWGVDYVIVKPDGSFAREPYNYRDSRTDNVPEEVFKTVPEAELYSRTGMQLMQINTLFQLVAHRRKHPEDFADGNIMLMIPDAISYLFSGITQCYYLIMKLEGKASYIGSKIFEADHLFKSFGDLKILDDFSYIFARYEKMGIVGNNGTGKSTFIKILMGQVAPDSGTVDVGETVRFGYYSQDGLQFDEQMKVIDVVQDIAEVIELGNGKKLTARNSYSIFCLLPKRNIAMSIS